MTGNSAFNTLPWAICYKHWATILNVPFTLPLALFYIMNPEFPNGKQSSEWHRWVHLWNVTGLCLRDYTALKQLDTLWGCWGCSQKFLASILWVLWLWRAVEKRKSSTRHEEKPMIFNRSVRFIYSFPLTSHFYQELVHTIIQSANHVAAAQCIILRMPIEKLSFLFFWFSPWFSGIPIPILRDDSLPCRATNQGGTNQVPPRHTKPGCGIAHSQDSGNSHPYGCVSPQIG